MWLWYQALTVGTLKSISREHQINRREMGTERVKGNYCIKGYLKSRSNIELEKNKCKSTQDNIKKEETALMNSMQRIIIRYTMCYGAFG